MARTSAADKAAKLARRAEEVARDLRTADQDREPDDEMTSDVLSMLQGLPAEVDLRLYKKEGGRMAFCQSFADPRDFSEEYVQKKWGAGSYRLMARVPDPGTGKPNFVKGGTKVFTIAEAPVALGGVAPLPNGASFQDSALAQMWTMMVQGMQQSQESHRAMMSMMLAQNTARTDPSVELLKVILPTLMQRESPFDVAVKMAELLKPAGPSGTLTDQLTALEKLLALVNKGETPDNAPPWLSALKEVAPLIGQAFQQRPQLAPVPNRPIPGDLQAPVRGYVPPVPAPVVTPPPTVTRAPEPGVVAHLDPAPPAPVDLAGQLDQLVPQLIAQAARNRDAAFYAEWTLDQIAEEQYEALDVLLSTPDSTLDMLVQRFPLVAPHRSWFGQLLGAMRDMLSPEPEPDAPTPPEDASA